MSDSNEWEVYYHDTSKVGVGRNEFIKLVFEEAGVKYKNVYDRIPELFKGGEWTGFPTFAPPLLKKGDFSLSQTGVICQYLGKKFGLYPENEEDVWHAAALNATIHDYLAEGRLAFHGMNHGASYFTQEKETQPYIDRFISQRLPTFLQHFEKALTANNGGTGFLVGAKLTYVDLALYHILRATENQFLEAWKNIDTIPTLKTFKERIEGRPNIAKYLSSNRCSKFGGNSMM